MRGINERSYDTICKIGEGTYGLVFKVRCN